MQVAKWGNSLAVRLPAALVEALELKEGDEIEIHVADARRFGVARTGRAELLRRLRAFRGRLPADFKFDRDGRMPAGFFDTNVLVYLASIDAAKADRAEAAVAAGGAISMQVLNEVANVARRKMQFQTECCRCQPRQAGERDRSFVITKGDQPDVECGALAPRAKDNSASEQCHIPLTG
jgi:antitoxin MazE